MTALAWAAALLITAGPVVAANLAAFGCLAKAFESDSGWAALAWCAAFFGCCALVLAAGVPGVLWMNQLSNGFMLEQP